MLHQYAPIHKVFGHAWLVLPLYKCFGEYIPGRTAREGMCIRREKYLSVCISRETNHMVG